MGIKKAVKKAIKKKAGGSNKRDVEDSNLDKGKDKKKDDDEVECPKKDGTFGKDFDKYPMCVDDCKHFDACSDAFDVLKEKKDKGKGKKLDRD